MFIKTTGKYRNLAPKQTENPRKTPPAPGQRILSKKDELLYYRNQLLESLLVVDNEGLKDWNRDLELGDFIASLDDLTQDIKVIENLSTVAIKIILY